MKKGQVEMMGLMIVVILIIIGGLFYLAYFLKDKDDTFKSTEREIQAVNAVKALLNLEVCEISFKEAVHKCAMQEELCEKSSCEVIDDFVREVYGKVIEDDYSFNLYNGDDVLLSIVTKECGSVVSSGFHYIEFERNYYEVNLNICYR